MRKAKKDFDCVELQHRAGAAIAAELAGMTIEKEVAYWAERTRALREWQAELRAERQARGEFPILRLQEHCVLSEDLPEHGLTAGDVGTVIAFNVEEKTYEVDFTTLQGAALAVVTLTASQVRSVLPGEMPHVRAMPV
jgi:hypothetical protein